MKEKNLKENEVGLVSWRIVYDLPKWKKRKQP